MGKINFTVAAIEDFGVDGRDRTAFGRPSSLTPLDAYLGLKSLFGEPNRDYIGEDKQQWAFLLKTENALIEVNDWKLENWSIHVYEKNKDEARAERLLAELERQIIHASSKQRDIASNLLKSPQGHVIENPFALYYRTAEELADIAEQLQSAHRDLSDSAPKLADWSTQYTLCRAAFFQLISAIEGLLNLIYEIYLRPELREDRIADRLAREQIDVKLRLAPIYCDCFSGKPIDHTTEAFRNFHSLVNSRNDFIHANVTKSMRTPVVHHDDITFLVRPTVARQGIVPNTMSDLGVEELKKIKAALDEILAQVLSNMKPRYRREFGAVIHDEYINVEYEDGVPIIIR